MKPSPAQVHQALLNYYRPLRTPDADLRDKLRDLEHVKNSHKKSPGSNQGLNTSTGIENEQRPHFIPPDK